MKKIYFFAWLTILTSTTSIAQNGLFAGATTFGYKSNFYNPADLEANDKLDYKLTLNGSYGLEFGYKFNGKWAISTLPQFAWNSQKYVGVIKNFTQTSYPQGTIESKAALRLFKIPLDFQHILQTDKRLKWTYTMGVYYAHVKSYKDESSFEYVDYPEYNEILIFEDKRVSVIRPNTSEKFGATLERFIYSRNIMGLTFASGFLYSIHDNFELGWQLRSDYSLLDIEVKERIASIPDPNSTIGIIAVNPFNKDYVKFSEGSNRPFTHLFNLGIALNARYYFNTSKK
jgi:hypothetical protein